MKKEISFGKWLYNRRRSLDLTRQALADQAGCAEITLRRIENNTLKPSRELALILLEKLGIPEEERPHWIGFARGLTGDPERPDASPSTKPPTNLPSLLTSFIGREKEQADVISLVAKHRVVTLLGMGGIGKTSLALHVGHTLLKDHPDGVWFIALDALTDPALVPQTVAAVFELRELGNRSSIEMLANKLREKTALLILDNCEHVITGCVQLITALLAACPNIKILATSRELLNVAGEAVYPVTSLSMPDEEQSLEELTENEAVRLFTERASLALPSFMLTKENVQTVVEICRRVDGMPLAIELAAVCVNFLQVSEILEQLQRSFALLSSDRHVTMSHHQTLGASLDWSWSLLNPAEQRVLRYLSVFAGGWTLESAQAVCDEDVLGLTRALVKKSLIKVEQVAGRATRYHFHEMVRQYAYRKLLESGEEATIRFRHLKYFLDFSERAEPALRGPQQVEWYGSIDEERDNIRAALEQAVRADLEAGLYLSGRLAFYWYNFDLQEGLKWTTKFVQRPESKQYPHGRAKALLAQGNILWYLQQFDVARVAVEECLALFRACTDRDGEFEGLLILGGILQFMEGMEQKTDIQRQALALALSLGDPWKKAAALSTLAWDQRDPQYSRAAWEEANAIFRQVGDWRSLAFNLAILGYTVLSNGEMDAAQGILDECLEINRRMNYKRETEFVLTAKGQIALMRGDYEQAREFLSEWAVLAEELGNRMGYLWARARIGYVVLREGKRSEAAQILVDVLENFHRDRNTSGLVFVAEKLASLSAMTNKPEVAARLIGWSDATRDEIGHPRPRLEQVDLDHDSTRIRRKIGNTAWEEAYLAGRSMTLDETVALALHEHKKYEL